MKKIKLSTEGLTGENLKFVEQLNLRFAELPEAIDQDEVGKQVRATLKGLFNEKGESSVDWAKVTKIDFDKLSELMSDEEGKGIRSILKKQGEVINALKELGAPGETRVRGIRDQIKDYHEKNKEKLKAFMSGETRSFGTASINDENVGDIKLETRAPHTMLLSNSTPAGTGGYGIAQTEVIPGVMDFNRARPFIEDYANTANTSRPRINWTEKYNAEGNAAFIAEGAVKPLISFDWRSFDSYAKKVADKIKVSTEALDDIDWLAAEIEAELKYKVDIKVDEELLTGAGDGTPGATTLKGLTTSIGGYVLTSIKTTTPNNFDALRAAYAQIVSLNHVPTHIFINPIDGANMDLVKDANGRPLMMEYRDAAGRLFRLQPIETNQIPVGRFLMGDMTRFRIRNYRPFAIYYGWVNDDFERNLVTVIGERRLHAFLSGMDSAAFVYELFSNVKTAILAA